MRPDVDWANLRALRGDQRLAFEELCSQLARYEGVPSGARFVRKGTPDAGLECFWQLPDAREWGWQAKWFPDGLDDPQWQQLDSSVRTALEKHPSLVRLTICLRDDLPDARVGGRTSALQRWEGHRAKWDSWACERGAEVQFDRWGYSEIAVRLSDDMHRGRLRFWFDREFLSEDWFERQVREAVADAAGRYMPGLHVDVAALDVLEALGGAQTFWNRLRDLSGRIRRAHASAKGCTPPDAAKLRLAELEASVAHVLGWFAYHRASWTESASMGELAAHVRTCAAVASQCATDLATIAQEERAERDASERHRAVPEARSWEYLPYHLSRLQRDLWELQATVEGECGRAADRGALLLPGDAGTGKTHLLCHVAEDRIARGLPTVLLHAGQFADEELWGQIARWLHLNCARDELLGALEAAGQAAGSRAVIAVDAVNEGPGKYRWSGQLGSILAAVGEYPWVAVVVSVRSSYEQLCIPPQLVQSGRLVRVEHHGFAGREEEAAQRYFAHYRITAPRVPILHAEYANPLFLRVVCQGLQSQGRHHIDPGLHGVTAAFGFFIEALDAKLSHALRLDYGPARLVQRAVEELAGAMADVAAPALPRADGQAIVDRLLPGRGYESSLYRGLLDEGLLSEDVRSGVDAGSVVEVVRFTYERFADHLIAARLLDRHLDAADPESSFRGDQPLGGLVADSPALWRNSGLIEALAVQLPERTGRELPELAPGVADEHVVKGAVVESLIWRQREAFSEATRTYINERVLPDPNWHDEAMDGLLTVACDPAHPYNADRLHASLSALGMADRDAWWSTYLHRRYDQASAMDRLVNWAWRYSAGADVDEEVAFLAGTALAWCLTTSHRFLRDRATKALVALLQRRTGVLRSLLDRFRHCDDPYVTERLAAVAYGCAMRAVGTEGLVGLAADVYDWLFAGGSPPPHLLLRDYGRGVIERAAACGAAPQVALERIRPPYAFSDDAWLAALPSVEELEAALPAFGDRRDPAVCAEHALHESVVGRGDFARYVIGTNSGYFPWSSRRRGEPRMPSWRETKETFVGSLTTRQSKAWDSFQGARWLLELSSSDRLADLLAPPVEADGPSFELPPRPELEALVAARQQRLRGALGRRKLRVFEEDVLPHLDDRPARAPHEFDLSVVQRWVYRRVHELGWTRERFAPFDDSVPHGDDLGRSPRKPERIGKKYQWIAYHEFLARASDTFEYARRPWSPENERYEGPWQRYERDIDPSCLLRRTGDEPWSIPPQTWWFPVVHGRWRDQPEDVAWLRDAEDCPSIPEVLVVTDAWGCEWVVVDMVPHWQEPVPPDEERFEFPRREIVCVLHGYIVRESDAQTFVEWARSERFVNLRLPEPPDRHEVFLGEFHWSPAYACCRGADGAGDEWITHWHQPLPCPVLVASESYSRDAAGYDCSLDEAVSLRLPARWVIEHLGLRWQAAGESSFIESGGTVVAFDPSVDAGGPSALLVRKEPLVARLGASGHELVWAVYGERNVISGNVPHDEWKGRLELNGAYRLAGGRPTGNLTARFLSRDSEEASAEP